MTGADPLATLSETARAWGAPLDALALSRVKRYLEDVSSKNATTNLTADDAWDDLVLKHAADGVFAAAALRKLLAARGAPEKPRILDLGAGGGFIGICLKIAWPEAEVTLMEAVERKYRFLNSAATTLRMQGLRPLLRRAGAGSPGSSYTTGFDAVVERALAPLPEAVRLAFPLLGPKGIFAAFQSDAPDAAEPGLARALAAAAARVLECPAYRRPGEARERRLVIFGREGE
ncbi:MAG TPA: RsmG family class I SAM-dependent methyltransferase [Elusimicrobiota bacterium]|nr:RsmG family class I SAM-dependent methyltransferase [Elusimicrobiota bacterium]